MYARKNPVARARIFREYKTQFGPVEMVFIAIEEPDDSEDEYLHRCNYCGVAMDFDSSFETQRARIVDFIEKRAG